MLRTGRSRSVALHPALRRRSRGSIPHGSPPPRSGLPPLHLPAFSGARVGRATPPSRSIKQTLQLRYADLAGSEARGNMVAESRQRGRRLVSERKTLSQALAGTTGVMATARGERTGRVNWGPSGAGGLVPQHNGIIHKPLGGYQRRRCGHSKRRADRTLQPDGEPRATGLVVGVRSSRCRLGARPTTEPTPGNEIPTVTAYKPARTRWRRWPWRQASLKPYWGKPAVRNFRGGRGNEVEGLMTFCHDARKSRYIGSYWPNHVRASALLDQCSCPTDVWPNPTGWSGLALLNACSR